MSMAFGFVLPSHIYVYIRQKATSSYLGWHDPHRCRLQSAIGGQAPIDASPYEPKFDFCSGIARVPDSRKGRLHLGWIAHVHRVLKSISSSSKDGGSGGLRLEQ